MDGYFISVVHQGTLEPFGSVSSPRDLVEVVRAAIGQYAPGLGWMLVYSERLLSAPCDLIYSSNQHMRKAVLLIFNREKCVYMKGFNDL